MKMAEEHNIDVLFTPKYVSMSYDQIFKENIRGIPNKSVINCHAGKLPYHRGRNILNWVLINDEKELK